jgi:predicted metalloprotease
MNHLGRRAIVIVLAMLLLVSASPALVAAQATSATSTKTAEVTDALQQIASLERDHDVNTLYDLLHPDVRQKLSREGLGAYYASPAALIPDGAYADVKVTFGDWTWPVTGKTYKDAATVTYTASGTRNGKPASETATQHLVLDGVTWRWFFGVTDAFVAQQDSAAAKAQSYKSPFKDKGYAAIDTYWASAFTIAGITYTPPREIIAVTKPIRTGCGNEDQTGIDKAGVYYCTVDHKIYYSPKMKTEVSIGFGSYAWYHIVAHEWGHHIQQLMGIDATRDPELDGGIYPIELELQADCLAGTYDQDALAKGAITEKAFDQALAITDVAGDRKSTKWDDPNAHGTDAQRRQSVLTGFDDGFIGCNLPLHPPEG